jgi:hypothetical protein
MPPPGPGRTLEGVLEQEVGVVGGSLYSGLVVLGAVALAFVAVALTVAQHA